MPFFVKKPIPVEMRQWDGTVHCAQSLARWSHGRVQVDRGGDETHLIVHTQHGKSVCVEGDWVVKGPAGEFYPITDAMKTATYLPVEE